MDVPSSAGRNAGGIFETRRGEARAGGSRGKSNSQRSPQATFGYFKGSYLLLIGLLPGTHKPINSNYHPGAALRARHFLFIRAAGREDYHACNHWE